MPTTWGHPELGKFTYDGGTAWTKILPAPAFKRFTYATGYKEPVPKGKVELAFDAYAEDEFPTKGMIAIAAKVMANLEALAKKMTASLWEDLNGRGPDSGMWWHGHGDRDQFTDLMGNSREDPPEREEDLLGLMRPYAIRVHKQVDGYEKAVAEIIFRAAFEEEHGVGVLTDGTKILGHGYGGDATPFQPGK